MACWALLGPACRRDAEPAALADRLAERWVALQRDDGTFLDSIRPDTHDWGRYGEAGRRLRPDARGRAHGPAGLDRGRRARPGLRRRAGAPDRAVGVREHADRVGLQPAAPRAPRHAGVRRPARRCGRTTCATIRPVYNARVDAPHLPSNKYLVEAVAVPRAGAQRPALGDPAAASLNAPRRGAPARAATSSTGSCRSASGTLPRPRRPGTASPRSRTATRQPLAYHASPLGAAGARDRRRRRPRVPARARRALRIGVAHAVGVPGARRRPRLLRPQPGPVVGARARRARRRRAPPAAAATAGRAPSAPSATARSAGSARSTRSARAGWRSCRRPNGPGDDPGDRRLRERGRLQRPHADGARLGRRRRPRAGCRAGRDPRRPRPRPRRVLPFEVGALRDAARAAACGWRSSAPRRAATAAPRSGSARSSTARAAAAGSTSCRRRPRPPGAPRGTFGPGAARCARARSRARRART